MDRLEAARNLPENSGAKQQFAIDTAKLILEDAGVKDPGMSVATPVEEKAVESLFQELQISDPEVLKCLAQEYNTQPHTPELVTRF